MDKLCRGSQKRWQRNAATGENANRATFPAQQLADDIFGKVGFGSTPFRATKTVRHHVGRSRERELRRGELKIQFGPDLGDCGAHGSVRLAVIPVPGGTGLPVALKVVAHRSGSNAATETEYYGKAIELEASCLRALGYRRVMTCCDRKGRAYITMELGIVPLSWLTSSQRATRHNVYAPMDGITVARLAAQDILRQLAVAQKNGVVHNDIRKCNVVLMPGARLALVDAGQGRIVGSDQPGFCTSVIHPNSSILAPELRVPAMQRRYFPSADLYSLGVLLLESLLEAQVRSTPDPASAQKLMETHSTLSPTDPLHALILQLLSDRPQDRGVASELLDHLEEPVDARAELMARIKAVKPGAERMKSIVRLGGSARGPEFYARNEDFDFHILPHSLKPSEPEPGSAEWRANRRRAFEAEWTEAV